MCCENAPIHFPDERYDNGYCFAATLPPSKAEQLPIVQSIHYVKKNMAFCKIVYQLLPPPSRREAYPLLTTLAEILASDKVTQASLREGGGKNRTNKVITVSNFDNRGKISHVMK